MFNDEVRNLEFTPDPRAVAADGKPRSLPQLTLTRGAERMAILRDGKAMVVMRGETGKRSLVVFDLESGVERKLTSFGRDVTTGDFDVSGDGSEIVFERRAESADILMIER